MSVVPTTKEIEAVNEWLKLQDVGAFEIMKKHYVESERFWKAYRYIKGGNQ